MQSKHVPLKFLTVILIYVFDSLSKGVVSPRKRSTPRRLSPHRVVTVVCRAEENRDGGPGVSCV